jgi:proton glutamate symport protein
MMKSLGVRVLIALVLGLAAGIALSAASMPAAVSAIEWIEAFGTIWINAIRMTVIPLVVSAIIVGIVSSPELGSIGRVGAQAIVLFLVILLAAACFSVLIAPAAFSFLTIDAAAAESLRAAVAGGAVAAAEGAQRIQTPQQWLIDMVPVNPIKAAADGAMLPLIVFSIAFGIAVTKVSAPARTTFTEFMRGIGDASLVLVGWVLQLAPLGVFALSLAIARRLGIAAAGAVVFYMVLVCIACTAFMALLYLVVAVSRRGVPGFPRFWAPAQAVAFSGRSSLVALPAMIQSAQAMRQPAIIPSFFLPLAVATFRTGAAINIPIGVLFIAKLYGVEIGVAELITIALTAVVTSFSVPGIPGGTIIVMVPALLAVNLPPAGIAVLLAVDTLPDMFRTTTNVTGDLAVAAILSKGEQPPVEPAS